MRLILALVVLITLDFQALANEKSIYDFKVADANNKIIDFAQFKGNPLMLVNIATRCGYTGQLGDLEELYKKYEAKGFQVIGIPSNDFSSQTPEDNKGVVKFCRLKYGTTFPITEKMVVKGKNKSEIMNYVIDSLSKGEEIAWNFEKFIFDKSGNLKARFKSSVKPTDPKVESVIQKLTN